MKRRDLVAAALTAPPLLFAGCASPASRGAGASSNPASAQITILYDAFGRDPAMQKDWGYAAFVEFDGKRILFDTGNNAAILARNAAAKGIDLARLDFVVMSHRHGDHMGGMATLLSANPTVKLYAPKEAFGVYGADLPSTFYRKDASLPPEQRYYDGSPPEVMRFGSAWPQANIALIDKTTTVAPGIHLISLVSDKPGTLELRELSLAIETPQGMVLVVGCSHAGIDNVVKAAAGIHPKIHLVAGGFHLVVAKDPDIEAIIKTLRDTFEVAYVAPGHCTGEPTFSALKTAFGDRDIYAGLGTTVSIERPAGTEQGQASSSRIDDDMQSYAELSTASEQRRRRLFGDLQRTAALDGAYLGRWGAASRAVVDRPCPGTAGAAAEAGKVQPRCRQRLRLKHSVVAFGRSFASFSQVDSITPTTQALTSARRTTPTHTPSLLPDVDAGQRDHSNDRPWHSDDDLHRQFANRPTDAVCRFDFPVSTLLAMLRDQVRPAGTRIDPAIAQALKRLPAAVAALARAA